MSTIKKEDILEMRIKPMSFKRKPWWKPEVTAEFSWRFLCFGPIWYGEERTLFIGFPFFCVALDFTERWTIEISDKDDEKLERFGVPTSEKDGSFVGRFSE